MQVIATKTSKISSSAKIAATAIIEDGVEIGDNTSISDFVIIRSGTKLGANNKIYPNVIIGEDPQDKSYNGENSKVIIGDNNIFREFVTIHKGTGEEGKTLIGNDNFLMVNVHVAHDCKLGNNITIANNVALGGHVEIEDCVNIGGNSSIHQNCRVGAYAMLGGQSAINADILPFFIYFGCPSQAISTNRIGLKRAGYDQLFRTDVMKAYKLVYLERLSVPKVVTKLEENMPGSEAAKLMLEFISKSKRGVVLDRTKSEDLHRGA